VKYESHNHQSNTYAEPRFFYVQGQTHKPIDGVFVAGVRCSRFDEYMVILVFLTSDGGMKKCESLNYNTCLFFIGGWTDDVVHLVD
jgi:hypothetical protein